MTGTGHPITGSGCRDAGPGFQFLERPALPDMEKHDLPLLLGQVEAGKPGPELLL